MPLYEYECFVCRARFERIQHVDDVPVRECPHCGGAVRRLLGVPALQFKGSGWYVTDYGKGSGSRGTNGGSKPASTGGAKDSSSATPEAPAKKESPSQDAASAEVS